MVGFARSVHWLAMLAVLPVVACGAAVEDEAVSESTEAVTTSPVRATLYSKRSSALRYRGKDADYIVCTGQPFNMAYTFKNTGDATWRDVDGKGINPGSDVKLVTTSGKRDQLIERTFLSVEENKNDWVRADRGAGNCSSKPGCRRTTFNSDGLWAIAPTAPGTYPTRWRLRDFSSHWDGVSKAFGPKTGLRFKVVACETQCGCVVTCTDGQKKEVPADETNCKDVGSAFCEPAQYLSHAWVSCGSGGTGGSGGSGTGGSGTGGSGTGGSGTGGSGTGGSGTGGSSGSYTCGGSSCELPDALAGKAEPCCAGTECGITTPYSTGQCVPLFVPDEDDPNAIFPSEPDPNDPDPYGENEPDDPGYFDPADAKEHDGYRGEAISEGSGCRLATGTTSSGGAALAALIALGLFARRRR